MNETELLNAIIEKTHEAIIAIDREGIIVKCNQKMFTYIGSSSQEVIGMPVKTVMPELEVDSEISNYEFKTLKKSFIVRTEKVVIEENQYEIFFFSDNHFNIELGSRYAETKVLKDTYESILNSIDEGIHVADINGNIKYINPSQQNIDGLTSDIIGKHWTEIYDLDDETSLVLQALKGPKYIHDQYQHYVTRGGKYVSIVCSAMPLFSEGKMIGAVAITKDFPRFKEMAERVLNIHEQTNQGHNKKINKTSENYFTFNQILGKDKLIQESIKWGKAGAKSDSSVLIYGETGTGKEMFAQSIHAESNRAGGPFLAINCAAIPENLLEGILFGTTKGAFTGAVDRVGLIELSGGGTIFLDEINSMPLQLQSKLLRIVEEKKIMRLGGKENTSVDVRIIASCNMEPSEAIEKGQLRSDLFYRLAVIYIYLPPLRNRHDDLDVLTDYYIAKFNREMQKQVAGISDEVRDMFQKYNWPGNVRELLHCIECAFNLNHEHRALIRPDQLPKYMLIAMQEQNKSHQLLQHKTVLNQTDQPLQEAEAPAEQLPAGNIIEQLRQQEKEEIIFALKKSKGNISQAAEELGLSRQRLHYRLKKYRLS
jgi:arginine utilization regulatory protein